MVYPRDFRIRCSCAFMIRSLCSRWLYVRNPGLHVSHTVLQQTPSLKRLDWQFHRSLRITSSLARLSSTSTRPEARKPWVEHLPPQIRPYLYLMRIDKPIGTLLLFYPCGLPYSFFKFFQVGFDNWNFSMVHYHGILRDASAVDNSIDIYWHFWSWSTCYEGCWLYDQ